PPHSTLPPPPPPRTPLFPYTTLFRSPPRLMLFVCQQPARDGGEVLLADGQAIYDDLAERHPEAVVELSQPGTAFFGDGGGHLSRSEEHTSELQSPCNLVCRLLLEKKN